MPLRHGKGLWRFRSLLLSNGMRRASLLFALLLANFFAVRLAHAQITDSDRWGPTGSQGMNPPAASSAQREQRVAEIVSVGFAENTVRLAQVIGDLLSAHGITPRFEQRGALTESDLAAQQNVTEPGRATVWILVPSATSARLVFADRVRQRFLIRDIPLIQGLDDFGRESIAQVVESSLLALLQGAQGTDRAEVRSALGPYLAPSNDQPRTPEPPPLAQQPPRSETAIRTHRALRFRLGVTYGLRLTGRDFGLQQGPGILSGLEFVRSSDSLFVVGAFEWNFERHHRTTEIDLAVQDNLMWLQFGWRKSTRDANFLAAIGPGVQLVRINPQLVTSSAVSVEQSKVHTSPWARMAAGFEWGDSPLVIQLLGNIDVSAYRTHYDIVRNGKGEELASSWVVQPGVAMAALWR
jgi:hypothetical protein